MTVTTELIIKMLPLDMELKKQLLDGWNGLSADQKYGITQTLWSAYVALYELTLDKNMEAAFLDENEKMDAQLYDRIKTKTEQEIQQLGMAETTSVDLSETREELQELLKQTRPSN